MSRTRRHLQTGTRPEAGLLLEVEDLRTHFETALGIVKAVDGVSFSLARGRALGIVGESGSGKTILSRSIMGLLPKRNTIREGSVRFEGQELTTMSLRARRDIWGAEMAMIFQDPMTSLNPVMKVGKQIAEPLRIHLDMSRADAKATSLRLLEDVGIPEPEKRLEQYPHELSGGMRQRIMIAMALACGPTLLFADEPTTALDVTVQAQILDLIQAQRQDRNMSVILVTHDLGVVAGHTDEIIVMYAGQIVEQAPTPVLFNEMRMPYTEALLESIPKLDQPSHTQLRAIAGRPPDLINPPKGCRFSPRCPYVQDRCRDEAPPLLEAETPGHLYACWYPVGSQVWHEVKARLDQAGTTTIPVSVEAAEPGDVVADAAELGPAAGADAVRVEAANPDAVKADADPHETPASSPGAS
jgi:peptide/nickel transport system ATP-binding protein